MFVSDLKQVWCSILGTSVSSANKPDRHNLIIYYWKWRKARIINESYDMNIVNRVNVYICVITRFFDFTQNTYLWQKCIKME